MTPAHEHIQAMIAAMEAAGVVPQSSIAGDLMRSSGEILRFACEGDGAKKNGWAVFYPEEGASPAAGAFGNYKQQTGTITWSAGRSGSALSPEERRKLSQQIERDKEDRERERQRREGEAAATAAAMWRDAAPADHAHDYLARKRMMAGPLRQSGDRLLVPMMDMERRIWNLQQIGPDGFKLFLKGARINGLFCVIGALRGSRSGVIVEGYATGDAVHQATGLPVVVAFNTANLPKVAEAWMQRAPAINWIVAADDDHKTGLGMVEAGREYKNPGIEVAQSVARDLEMKFAAPPSYRERMLTGEEPEVAVNQDFSDLFCAGFGDAITASLLVARRVFDDDGPVPLAEQIGRAA